MPEPAAEGWFEATFNAAVVNVRVINGAIAGALAEVGVARDERHDVTLGIAELVTNITRHEYRGDGDREIRCRIAYGPRSIAVTLRSDGPPFNPLEDAPDVDLERCDPEPGGLGLFIVRSLFDESRWRYHEGRNELTLVRKRTDLAAGGEAAAAAPGR